MTKGRIMDNYDDYYDSMDRLTMTEIKTVMAHWLPASYNFDILLSNAAMAELFFKDRIAKCNMYAVNLDIDIAEKVLPDINEKLIEYKGHDLKKQMEIVGKHIYMIGYEIFQEMGLESQEYYNFIQRECGDYFCSKIRVVAPDLYASELEEICEEIDKGLLKYENAREKGDWRELPNGASIVVNNDLLLSKEGQYKSVANVCGQCIFFANCYKNNYDLDNCYFFEAVETYIKGAQNERPKKITNVEYWNDEICQNIMIQCDDIDKVFDDISVIVNGHSIFKASEQNKIR